MARSGSLHFDARARAARRRSKNSGRELGRRVFGLVAGIIVDASRHAVLELFLGLTQGASELWKLRSAEEDENDDENDE